MQYQWSIQLRTRQPLSPHSDLPGQPPLYSARCVIYLSTDLFVLSSYAAHATGCSAAATGGPPSFSAGASGDARDCDGGHPVLVSAQLAMPSSH